MNRRIQSILYAVIWGLFLIVFIGLGYSGSGTTLLPKARTQSTATDDQYATTDAFLSVLRIPHPSASIQSAIAALPPGIPIVVVGSNNDSTLESRYCVISYLVWPRQVYLLNCVAEGQQPRQFRQVNPPPEGLKIAGLLFYRREPPSWLPDGKAIGPLLKLVPASETTKWTSYCF